ncbi:hypothetical protein ONZ43_g1921 [Nemania bipapillata]|uniref:Uncharacterized protein n=1 Tax=Nemania bipapillata TaxID=110536 RepID=A0ACC2J3C0_9PEZI|nr:hypothetical protein ONZ43_g1921 [Nemania bipapillata]
MAKPTRPAFMPANLIIEPSMFDALTFKPACDDRSIVRYSPTTGAVTAATPPRLVAEITSPSFLDYDLISDFFLTFRSFLNSTDLLHLLMARLRWALSQDDESDDFVVDYHLRVAFCDLLNDFTDDLPTSQPNKKVPFKIVGELKKCWRRVCVQYWDGPEFDAELGPDVAITPGGIAGHRDPSLTPSFWETDSSEALQVDGGSTQHVDSPLRNKVRPSTPEEGAAYLIRQPTSPMSIASLDVVSCSFPTKALRLGDPNVSMPLGAHPVDPSSIYTSTDPIASTPALMAKRMRPHTSHRRNNSLTDSLREHGTITEKVLYKNAELLLTLPYAGSLVRGNLLPPSQPFVDLDSTTTKGGSRQTTVFEPQPIIGSKRKASASAMSGQGMRKLLGSVRRALSTRGLGISHPQGNFIDIAPIGPRGVTTNRLPGTPVVPQARYSPRNGIKPPFRIDTLGAQIAEDFNQAVREDTAETKSASSANRSVVEKGTENVDYSVAHMDTSFDLRPRSDAAITTGSKSIVIVDGTAPSEQFVMTGALPPFNPSVETFADMYSDSLHSSYIRSPVRDSDGFVDVVSSDYSQNRGEVFSLGALAEQGPKRPLSLFSTHSSKPAMRPSFEAEAQKLAQIPDDVDDDGGVESALLKLEGKYERKTAKLSMEPLKIPSKDLQNLSAGFLPSPGAGQAEEEKKKHRHLHITEEEVPEISPIGEESIVDNFTQSHIPRHSEISSFLSEDSLETYNSVPLLDRGFTDEAHNESEAPVSISPQDPSFEFINRTESLEGATGLALAVNFSEGRSFLDVESDNDSELSSELSAEIIDESNYMPRPLSSNQVEAPHIRSHTLQTSELSSYLDDEESSIKLTLVQALQMSPETVHTPELHEHQLWSQKPLPPTPDTTPTTAMYHQALGSPLGSASSPRVPGNPNKLVEELTEQTPVHLPFILAFDSETLAQQFTLIEKDALNEVDWKELIEMKWKDSHNDSRSWVDFLRNTDARGVEVVIARFNIVVKWAISEIVLTQELEERARCIIKLLHIAAHCREFRNFATMSQITFALTSNEVGRLSKTWAMVPPTDMKTMKDLETLVSPTRNFYNLRAEMEAGGSVANTVCIPFIGIYTHDLLLNTQRPSEIASSLTNPPLVNFERCRTTASIVKTLLRLLEASTHYEFQPIEGITERCLWMGALSDQEIRRRFESLE